MTSVARQGVSMLAVPQYVNPGVPWPKPTKQVKQRTPGRTPYKAASMDQEDQVALDLTVGTGIPFERVKLSGSVKEHPGDVRSNRRVREPSHKLLIECKVVSEVTTRGETVLTVKLEWLDQILLEAGQENSLPVLLVQFRGDPRRFVTLRFEDLVRLLAEHRAMTEAVGS